MGEEASEGAGVSVGGVVGAGASGGSADGVGTADVVGDADDVGEAAVVAIGEVVIGEVVDGGAVAAGRSPPFAGSGVAFDVTGGEVVLVAGVRVVPTVLVDGRVEAGDDAP